MPSYLMHGTFMGHKPRFLGADAGPLRGDVRRLRSGTECAGDAAHLVGMNDDPTPRARASVALEPLLSVEELSDYLGVPVRTLYDWRVDHRGPKAVHAGRALRYPESAIRAWIQENLDA